MDEEFTHWFGLNRRPSTVSPLFPQPSWIKDVGVRASFQSQVLQTVAISPIVINIMLPYGRDTGWWSTYDLLRTDIWTMYYSWTKCRTVGGVFSDLCQRYLNDNTGEESGYISLKCGLHDDEYSAWTHTWLGYLTGYLAIYTNDISASLRIWQSPILLLTAFANLFY